MQRNIRLAYVLSFLNKLWFWGGIWIFYYLLFTNYAGIGLIETVMIVSIILFEIPTGAITDIIGKRKALIVSFFILTVGDFLFARATHVNHLLIAVVIAISGRAFYSGTMEALIYDSLKEIKKEDTYDKVISNITSIELISMAVASIIGGFMYRFSPQMPFYAVSFSFFVGFIISFFLQEPKIDTEKFTLNSFFIQTVQGFRQLFKSKHVMYLTVSLLSITSLGIITYQFLGEALLLGFGYSEVQLGFFVALLCVTGAITSQYSPYFVKRFKFDKIIIVTTLIFLVSLIISPIAGIISGGLFTLIRASSLTVLGNMTSKTINDFTETKYRATTLSTFNLISNIPYVITAFFIGSLIDIYSVQSVAFGLGSLAIVVVWLQLVLLWKYKYTH